MKILIDITEPNARSLAVSAAREGASRKKHIEYILQEFARFEKDNQSIRTWIFLLESLYKITEYKDYVDFDNTDRKSFYEMIKSCCEIQLKSCNDYGSMEKHS